MITERIQKRITNKKVFFMISSIARYPACLVANIAENAEQLDDEYGI